jgi:small ligand-binding sensory domain FIST
VMTEGTVVSLLSGQARVAWSSNHGCVPIGTAYEITKAEGNLIYELDHRPVFEVLRQYLTETDIEQWNRMIVSFCFGLTVPGQDALTIRYLPRKDEVAGSVMLQTEVHEGSQIWVMRRDQAAIVKGTAQLAQDLNQQLQGQTPKLVFQFDCYGRGRSVFTEQQKTSMQTQLQQDIGPQVPWLGFYSHGEIAPIGTQNAFHNYTLVLAAIY